MAWIYWMDNGQKISQSSKIPAFLAMQIMDQANQMQAAGGDLVHLKWVSHHHRHQRSV